MVYESAEGLDCWGEGGDSQIIPLNPLKGDFHFSTFDIRLMKLLSFITIYASYVHLIIIERRSVTAR